MKVLFIQKMAGISGSELYFLKIMPLLRANGIDCRFLSISLPQDVEAAQRFNNEITSLGVPLYKIETKSVLSLSLLKNINSIIRKEDFDLVHTHLIHADFWGACVKLLFNRKLKLVSNKHGFDEGFQADYGFDHTKKRYDQYYLTAVFAEKLVNRSAAVSKGLYDFYIGKGICESGKIETIPFGFDFDKDANNSNKENCRFFDIQLLIVGRIIPYKGHSMVLECLPNLVKDFPGLGLVLVGRGSSEVELKNQVKALNLEKHVRFEGFRTNVHDYLAHSDITLMPSRSEGFGIVLLEAWHHKKPVVAFDVPAPNTIIINNKNGVLVPPFDLQVLKEKLAMLIKEPEERKRLGEAGYQSLITDYSPQKMVASTIKLYNKVLNET